MAKSYLGRLAGSTPAAAVLCLRQALRQQWFLLTFIPFAVVVLAAPFMPAASETAAYQLLLRVVLSAGSVILFVGVIMTGSAGLPAELRDKTAHRSVASPGGRLTVLTGRIAAFSILAALSAGVGFVATILVFGLRGGSAEFTAASRQHHSTPAEQHTYAGKHRPGVLWIDEKAPSMTWVFSPGAEPARGKLQIQVLPVVASTVATQARLTLHREDAPATQSATIKLFDNCPTNTEFTSWPRGKGPLRVTVERLPDSSPFGFDVRKNELGSEHNGVSLLTGTRPFAANLLAAWFVVWVKLSFIASLAVFASTFLSAPIAGALSLLLYLLANIIGFLSDFAHTLGHPGHVHSHIEHILHEPTFFEKAVKALVTGFTRIYPDLSRFDSTEALIWGRAMPLQFLLLTLLYFLAYSALLWGISALILRRREF